ncbi:MAG: hypothetical protein HY363_04395 [Candidatus Aenigmarchaeota archaeon]|nr:hypothetical protein [Candidatus Aenigmarchaeota archaeon]
MKLTEVIEQYLLSKTGNADGGEDRLVVGPNFYGVVDGATDKTGNNWGNAETPRKGGTVLADIAKKVLEDPNTPTKPDAIVEIINKDIAIVAQRAGIDLSIVNNRADVGFAVYVPLERAVYHINDCSFGFVNQNGLFEMHKKDKAVDKLTANIRATVIKWYEAQGYNPFEKEDKGREFIMELLKRQPEIQNHGFDNTSLWVGGIPCCLVSYKTLNGLPTTLDITPVPLDTVEVIIASDGFATIMPTLNDTLAILEKHLKQDPHCIDILKSTKGYNNRQKSYDDMSYLRIMTA